MCLFSGTDGRLDPQVPPEAAVVDPEVAEVTVRAETESTQETSRETGKVVLPSSFRDYKFPANFPSFRSSRERGAKKRIPLPFPSPSGIT